MAAKNILISAIDLLDLGAGPNVPTVLLYSGGGKAPLIGWEAINSAPNVGALIEDFKIALGDTEIEAKAPLTPFITAAGQPKSAPELAKDFIGRLLRAARQSLDLLGRTSSCAIVLAEPLAFNGAVAGDGWLANYRGHLKAIAAAAGFNRVDFIPEPFAVFQYYRHGLRHQLIAQRAKQAALVVDFGGGTCDVCVVETTAEGEISDGGRNSRPLAACSAAIGGFAINRLIAIHLLERTFPKLRAKISKGLDAYNRWRSGQSRDCPPEFAGFARAFNDLVHRVERDKIRLCRQILDWGLEVPLTQSAEFEIPVDPFAPGSAMALSRLSASELRALFVEKVWKARLGPLIRGCLARAKSELNGAPVSLVLLSGGSANIGWLASLIEDEQSLDGVAVLPIPDYQEVVAKGLAIECARRFYSGRGTGDFSGVLYNRLSLKLRPDDISAPPGRFKPVTAGLPEPDAEGTLLPSAHVIGEMLDTPLQWKVRLPKPPRHSLTYHFLRGGCSEWDGDQFTIINLEECRAVTPPGTNFDGSLRVELCVGADGTASPTFVYRAGGPGQERVARRGRPFYLDMVLPAATTEPSTAYIGIDFGSSNSSISYVEEEKIQAYRSQARRREWVELGELANRLPFPMAEPLAKYLGCGSVDAAIEFIEGGLALGAYTAYLEYCAVKGRAQTHLFRNLAHRSAGPLLAILRDVLDAGRGRLPRCTRLAGLLKGDSGEVVKAAVVERDRLRHGKGTVEGKDFLRAVEVIANTLHDALRDASFGFFEGVRKERFGDSFRGSFWRAHGRPSFSESLDYRGDSSFADGEACLIWADNGEVMRFEPLIFWGPCKRHPDLESPGHCFLFDKPGGAGGNKSAFCSYKAAGSACSMEAADEAVALSDEIANLREADPERPLSAGTFGARLR